MEKKIVFVEFQLFNISKKNVFTFEVFSFDADGQRAGGGRRSTGPFCFGFENTENSAGLLISRAG